MSHALVSAAFQIEGISDHLKVCLTVLADYQNYKTKLCCPYIDTLKKRLNCSRAAVFRRLKKLKELGYLVWKRTGRYNLFEVILPVDKRWKTPENEPYTFSQSLEETLPSEISDVSLVRHRNEGCPQDNTLNNNDNTGLSTEGNIELNPLSNTYRSIDIGSTNTSSTEDINRTEISKTTETSDLPQDDGDHVLKANDVEKPEELVLDKEDRKDDVEHGGIPPIPPVAFKEEVVSPPSPVEPPVVKETEKSEGYCTTLKKILKWWNFGKRRYLTAKEFLNSVEGNRWFVDQKQKNGYFPVREWFVEWVKVCESEDLTEEEWAVLATEWLDIKLRMLEKPELTAMTTVTAPVNPPKTATPPTVTASPVVSPNTEVTSTALVNRRFDIETKEMALSIPKNIPIPKDVDPQVWQDWLKHRQARQAGVTITTLREMAKQAQIAGMSLEEAMVKCIYRGWIGFEAAWVKNRRDRAERNEEFIQDHAPVMVKKNGKKFGYH